MSVMQTDLQWFFINFNEKRPVFYIGYEWLFIFLRVTKSCITRRDGMYAWLEKISCICLLPPEIASLQRKQRKHALTCSIA